MEKGKNKTEHTFKFNWVNTKQQQGKAFVRKRKADGTLSANALQLNIAGESSKKLPKNKTKTVTTSGDASIDRPFSQPAALFEGGLIKRKRKKEKQLAATDPQEGASNVASSNVNRPKRFSLFDERHKNFYVQMYDGKSVCENVFASSGKKFDALNIHRHLLSNLEKYDFVKLTNVQEKSIPVIMSGKNTLIRSQTGSGKTLTYVVPIIDSLQGITPNLRRTDGVQAIIVVPTRELALQTQEFFNKLNTFQRIIVGHLCGGENRKTEKDRLRKGVNVLIGTPGRLLDHILHTKALKVDKVRCLILDEADRLLDMGFKKDIVRLVDELKKSKNYSEYDPLAMLKNQQHVKFDEESENSKTDGEEELQFPLRNINSKALQTILLSATLTPAVSELADFALKDHVYVDALDQKSNVISNSMIIPDSVKQEVIVTPVKQRLITLAALIAAKSKQNAKMFIFVASIHMVEFFYKLFTRYLAKLPKNRGKVKFGDVLLYDRETTMSDSDEEDEEALDTEFFKLHGSMDQSQRKEVFAGFKAAKKGVLICTDVAARGLDVPSADCIVQYTAPQTDEDYLHRVGRTGRAGKAGNALIFLTHDEQEYIARLQEYRVFLKEKNPGEYLHDLCELMEEPDKEKAATSLQMRFENAVRNDKQLYREACFAYSSWSRFYNSYPTKMRQIFDFKKVNLGHYVTSFAIRDTPSAVARVVRGQVAARDGDVKRLNKKLANHPTDEEETAEQTKSRKRKVFATSTKNLISSEYSSGLEPIRKKKKKKKEQIQFE